MSTGVAAGGDTGDPVDGRGGTAGGVRVGEGWVTVAAAWPVPAEAVNIFEYDSFPTGLRSGGVDILGLFWADKLTSKLWNDVGGNDPATVYGDDSAAGNKLEYGKSRRL